MDDSDKIGENDRPIITFQDLGINVESPVQQTIIGKARTCKSITKLEWAFLICSITSLLFALCLTIYRMAKKDNFNEDDFTFALLLLLNIGFSFYYIVHGILKERSNELLVFVATICVVLIYCITNYITGEYNLIKLIRLILVCVIGPFIIICGAYFGREYYMSGHLLFRTVGANEDDQKMCKLLFLESSLLKFDLQLQSSMLILVLETGMRVTTFEIVVLSVGLVTTVVWICIGFLCMRLENKGLFGIFCILSVCEPGYILYKMSISFLNEQQDEVLQSSIMTCGVFGLVIWCISIVVMVLVMRNFGKGLKEKVYGPPSLSKSRAGTTVSHVSQATEPAILHHNIPVGPEQTLVHQNIPGESETAPVHHIVQSTTYNTYQDRDDV